MNVAEWYEIVRKSRLVDVNTLSSWRIECQDCSNVHDIATKMSAAGILTEWQSEKLLDGRGKGFCFDSYCIRKLLGRDDSPRMLVFETMDMRDRSITILQIIPPSRTLRDDGSLIYSIQSKE